MKYLFTCILILLWIESVFGQKPEYIDFPLSKIAESSGHELTARFNKSVIEEYGDYKISIRRYSNYYLIYDFPFNERTLDLFLYDSTANRIKRLTFMRNEFNDYGFLSYEIKKKTFCVFTEWDYSDIVNVKILSINNEYKSLIRIVDLNGYSASDVKVDGDTLLISLNEYEKKFYPLGFFNFLSVRHSRGLNSFYEFSSTGRRKLIKLDFDLNVISETYTQI